MTSGVYELTFSNGDRYIGKSINIETRWKQHLDKFQKGTAARNMQQAYNTYGAPSGDILCKCHSDHIDILEACYIARHNPELNSDRPLDPFEGVSEAVLNNLLRNTNIFDASTWQHIEVISDLTKAKESLTKEVKELEELNDQLLVKRTQEEINNIVGRKLNNAHKELDRQKKQLTDAEIQINQLLEALKYANRPWWQSIFS